MTLFEKINKDMVTYMKNKDSFSLGVIRMVKGAIQLETINKKKELTDDEVIAVISKQIKMRNDSINEFEKANRLDLVEQNKKEIAILNEYMPEQLSEDDINKIIDEAFNKINPTSSKDMGLIMKEVSPKLKGRADMGKVNAIIKEKIANL
ncbi:MAG: GatB/YqeY domain-containing protein [Bacilli bacterium]|nr:GatB/YqeY domain-containing protein [Bacilli bacterium]